ncbi:MAG: type III restriction endonuclease subunit R, partial [Methylococcaceae bacterium]|nr:type III restriction endonuclease subunit R [Methylococcaceae bacterium]
VELCSEPTEIVIHVNMLKEGWDVTNLYTIVPLRAANARVLIEQSIGRGLRLPYGKRAGVTAVDRLNIVAHDKFQEIIDEANKPGSPIRLQAVVLDTLKYPAVSDELWIQHLRAHQREIISLGRSGIEEARLEDYVVSGLVDFDDISYDDHADLLYDLAAQTVQHFLAYLSEEDASKVLRCYQRDIARFIHAQMQEHYWEDVAGYEVKISKGFTELKPSAYTYSAQEPPANYRVEPADKSNMAKYLFGGFQRCLYPVQKFDSDSERKLAVILERDAIKWFKPARGQFQIFYRQGADTKEYQPDFIAETSDTIYMLEPKKRTELNDPIVAAKLEAAVRWCANASNHAATYGGKPWLYLLIPHDEIASNITLGGLAARFGG